MAGASRLDAVPAKPAQVANPAIQARIDAAKAKTADVKSQQEALRAAKAQASMAVAQTLSQMDPSLVPQETPGETKNKSSLFTTKNMLIGGGVLAALGAGVFFFVKRKK